MAAQAARTTQDWDGRIAALRAQGGARSCCSAAPGARSAGRFAGGERSRGNASHRGAQVRTAGMWPPRSRVVSIAGRMGDSQATGARPPGGSPDAERLPDASNDPPPLLDGIVRVKVPPDKIQPFLTKSALFKG